MKKKKYHEKALPSIWKEAICKHIFFWSMKVSVKLLGLDNPLHGFWTIKPWDFFFFVFQLEFLYFHQTVDYYWFSSLVQRNSPELLALFVIANWLLLVLKLLICFSTVSNKCHCYSCSSLNSTVLLFRVNIASASWVWRIPSSTFA